jgi:hypothetical protein
MSELPPDEPSIATAADPGTRKAATSRHEYLLAELRCATLRARLWQADIEAVGLALKATLITPAQALELLHDCDVLRLVGPPHEEAQP